MTKPAALKLRKNDIVIRKRDGKQILVGVVWAVGSMVYIKGWTNTDALVTLTHREVESCVIR